jgi:tol-pal system protein YbgF
MTSRTIRAFAAAAVLAVLSPALPADAQDGGANFFERMFGRPERPMPPETTGQVPQPSADYVLQIERLEAQVRQLTGEVEQLQHRNRQLEAQIRQLEGARSAPQASPAPARGSGPLPAPAPGPSSPARKADVFDPTQNPDAPGAPRPLGGGVMQPPPVIPADPPTGIAGGRAPGAPLDLSTLAAGLGSGTGDPGRSAEAGALPPPPSRNLSATGAVAAVAPPSDSPKDHFDLAYGYLLRKDYALAEDAFEAFLKKFPKDRRAGDARYWLGESQFQRQRYDAAASNFLDLSTKNGNHPKAPEALLRLGQSLAALNQKEMACATLAEVGRKYPRAPNSVKQGVEREQKRVRC